MGLKSRIKRLFECPCPRPSVSDQSLPFSEVMEGQAESSNLAYQNAMLCAHLQTVHDPSIVQLQPRRGSTLIQPWPTRYVAVEAKAMHMHMLLKRGAATDFSESTVDENCRAEQKHTLTPSSFGVFTHVESMTDNNTARRGFGRQSNKAPQNQQSQGQNKGNNIPSPTIQTPSSLNPSSSQNLPNSPALSATMSFDSPTSGPGETNQYRNPPFFFREKYATLIVKGNFMTLAAKPLLIEEGEWLAHQGNDLLHSHFMHLPLPCHCHALPPPPF